MVIPTERKVSQEDYYLIRTVLSELDANAKAFGYKVWTKFIDIDGTMDYIMRSDHAYIIGDYLVMYDIGSPWYNPRVKFLFEEIVARLTPGGSTFEIVPLFLEQKAREAGAKLVSAGTALAPSDAALASKYEKSGYKVEAYNLTKEV